MLHWIVLPFNTSLVGQFCIPLYSHYREVETLTQEDRDIMNGSTFFVAYIYSPTSLRQTKSCARHITG